MVSRCHQIRSRNGENLPINALKWGRKPPNITPKGKKMLINALSFSEAQTSDTSVPIISIQDSGYEEFYNLKHKTILRLTFDDVTSYTVRHRLLHPFYEEAFKTREPILFNEEMALQIFSFAEKARQNNQNLFIHCWAGMSRSVAVALCLNTIFNLLIYCNISHYNSSLKQILTKAMPNSDVIKITMQTYLTCVGES